MGDESWRKTKLALERPYKDENSQRIPLLLDIDSQGNSVYESYGVLLGLARITQYSLTTLTGKQIQRV